MKEENKEEWSSITIAKCIIAIPFGILGGIELGAGIIGTIGLIILIYFISTLFFK